MPRPRVFLSSTFYDLRYVRESLAQFIKGLGYEPVLSEKGDIPYAPYVELDKSCFRDVRKSDMLVLILGSRYGSAVSGESSEERNKSITEGEFLTAQESSIPVYIGIEAEVWAEFKTFEQNRDNPNFNYAHAESVEVYKFIDRIVSQKTSGRPIFAFHETGQFEGWLHKQWTGLFQMLLENWRNAEEAEYVSNQLQKLEEHNKTLQRYLEKLVNPDLVEHEKRRLEEEAKRISLRSNPFFRWLHRRYRLALDDFIKQLKESTDRDDFAQKLAALLNEQTLYETIAQAKPYDQAIVDLNRARQTLGMTSYDPS